MRTVRNKFIFYSSRLNHHRIKFLVFLFLVPFTLQGGFNQQEFAYADPEPGSIGSIATQYMKRSNEQAFLVMQEQLRAYKEKLQESERNVEDFQQAHGIVSLEAQIDLLLGQRDQLDGSLKKARNQAKGFQEKLDWVQGQIRDVEKEIPLSSTISEAGAIGAAKNQLLGLQLKERQLLTKYTESSPFIRALHEEMEVIEQFIAEQDKKKGSETSGKNPVYHEMEMVLFRTKANLVSAEAQSTVIDEQIAAVDKELERLRGLRPGLEELRRQVKADEKNYLDYLTKVGTTPPQDYQVQVQDELDIKFFFNPELNETVLVRPDGRIALQLIGEVSVVGYAVEEIREILVAKYASQLKNPEIAVLLRSSHVRAGDASTAPTSNQGRGGSNGN
jgi:protein involved in polysaccharide export with SLBB domain